MDYEVEKSRRVVADLDQLQRDVYAVLASPGRLYRPDKKLSRLETASVRRVCEMLQDARQDVSAALPPTPGVEDNNVLRQLQVRADRRARHGTAGEWEGR